MIDYTMSPIRTVYAGIQFRSRLEARWAAFFDLCGWQYRYEPIDLHGWHPDFLLKGERNILVEVKPVWEFDDIVAQKMERNAPNTELLLLGKQPFWSSTCPYIGWIGEVIDPATDGYLERVWWAEAAWGQWEGCGNPGFCHAEATFRDRITGQYDGGCYGKGEPPDLRRTWVQAHDIIRDIEG